MIKVCVLTDSPAYRAGITALLREGEGSEIQILDPDEALGGSSSNVFILFYDEIEKFRAKIIDLKVVFLINREEKGDWFLSDHDNGWGLLPYDASAQDLIAVVAAVDRGMAVLPPGELRRTNISDGDGMSQEADLTVETLTDREMDIMQYLGQGHQNKQIALALGISENTVKFHVASIFSKLGVSNRTEAVRVGNKHGLISL
jgi:DNA-binding NarL/FixJ family response regulator